MQFLRNLFDTSKRDVEALQPTVQKINALESTYQAMSDADLAGMTTTFKERLGSGASLDDLLPDAFAVAREMSKRKLNMRQFDVQLLGGVVLHQGRISEMKTGEGKTLVAVAPLYLNALSGKGAHLVTANDYLARRDAVWMGPVYHSLGLSVGIIQGQGEDQDELGGSYLFVPGCDVTGDPRYLHLQPISRRDAYLCDIVYGTNHEYGFDYLRDNMAFHVEQLSQRELNFAIVDEVDSILIDEARTPHIISGPSTDDVSLYQNVNKIVKQLQQEVHYTVEKKNHTVALTEEGMDTVEEMMDIDSLAHDPKLFHHVNASVKAYALFDKDVEYVVRGGEVVLVDENTGRLMFGRRLSDGLHQALEAKEGVPVQRESQTVAVITFQNLFRLYNKLAGMTGTAKTEEDEFRKIYGLDVVSIPTHRPMIRKDEADVIYKTEEAKFRGIAWEILRLFSKQQPVLVGTRSIEMSERVSSRLTTELLKKMVLAHRLRYLSEVKKSIPKELKDDATRLINSSLNEVKLEEYSTIYAKMNLSGDTSQDENLDYCLEQFQLGADNKAYLKEALKHGIPHNILNAKFHEREALIIAEAGRKGGVTIATNMAGRGVDILLGGRIHDEQVERSRASKGDVHFEGDDSATYRRGGSEDYALTPLPLNEQERSGLAEDVRALGGLFILGTERHESRRIDNQLRGRAGRQGDPGTSRFFVSLEDQLWKVFNANMMDNPLLKTWPPMEEVNTKFLSKMIEKTQERIENHFFEARKHVLEYDDILNAQREHVYGMRRDILLGSHVREDLIAYIRGMIAEIVQNCWEIDEQGLRFYDYEALYEDLNEIFPLLDYAKLEDLEAIQPDERLEEYCSQLAMDAYHHKAETLGEEVMKFLEQQVMLRAVNDRWMDHLQMIDYIREGINLRAYAQVDPLVAYKKETFELFQNTLRLIRDQAVRLIFRAEVTVEAPAESEVQMERIEEPAGGTPGIASSAVAPQTINLDEIDWTKVSRNDPCPCGSGKKFKVCHYPILRQTGVI